MSDSTPNRPFDNIINFRDVGETINRFAGKRLLKEGVLFRSARLDEASQEDIHYLTNDLHIPTVIDLRSTTEHQMGIKKYKRAHDIPEPSTSPASAPDPNPQDEGYIHLPDLGPTSHRHLISLTGKAFERQLLWRLDWWNFGKVLAYIAAGYRQDAVRIVGENVMKPAGLTGLAMTTLEASTVEVKSIFELLASDASADTASPASGVLVHCTQGKDRTGLIVLLSLLLAGVEGDAISREYILSEKELENEPAEEKEQRMKEIRALGLDEEYVRCPKDFVERVTGFLGERFGGVRGYLEYVGVGGGVVEEVRRRFVV